MFTIVLIALVGLAIGSWRHGSLMRAYCCWMRISSYTDVPGVTVTILNIKGASLPDSGLELKVHRRDNSVEGAPRGELALNDTLRASKEKIFNALEKAYPPVPGAQKISFEALKLYFGLTDPHDELTSDQTTTLDEKLRDKGYERAKRVTLWLDSSDKADKVRLRMRVRCGSSRLKEAAMVRVRMRYGMRCG